MLKVRDIKQGSLIKTNDGKEVYIGMSYNGLYRIHKYKQDIGTLDNDIGIIKGYVEVELITGSLKTEDER